MGYSPWDRKESNTTEQLQFTFTLRSQELKITRLFCPQDFLGKNAGCCCCSVSKLCPILCDKVDCSIPGSSVLKFMFIESLMLCNQLILCRPLLLLPSILSSIKVFSNESALPIRWPKYWTFSISLSSEYSGLISFRIDWLNLLAAQGTLSRDFFSTTVQKHQFFGTQLSLQSNSHLYMTTGKITASTRWTFVGKVMSWLFNMLSRLVIDFLPRSKCPNFMDI